MLKHRTYYSVTLLRTELYVLLHMVPDYIVAHQIKHASFNVYENRTASI